jgi:hypothetical protein
MRRLLVRWRARALLPIFGAVASALLQPDVGEAQQRRQQQPPRTPRESAPYDLAGYWVSLVSEDWRVRMLMGQKGDWLFMQGRYGSLNAEGLRAANAADPVNEAPCMAYGAAGIMRVPGRLRISWEDDSTLRIETDAGEQTRLLRFGTAEPAGGAPTPQGHSVARWERGDLTVVTTQMSPGYYFKHGVPYSEQATMTEYFTVIPEPDAEYLFVTTTVVDPLYLDGSYDRTLTFKREHDGTQWTPTACTVP